MLSCEHHNWCHQLLVGLCRWGNFANTLVILLLLAMQGATTLVSERQAMITWRVQVRAEAINSLSLLHGEVHVILQNQVFVDRPRL